MFCFIREKQSNGTLKYVGAIESLPGENRAAFANRAAEGLDEGQSVSDVYSRFSSVPANQLAAAWRHAVDSDMSTEDACAHFHVDPEYVGAWRSAVKAAYSGKLANRIPDRLPEDVIGDEEEEAAL